MSTDLRDDVREFTKVPEPAPPTPNRFARRIARVKQSVISYFKREYPIFRLFDAMRLRDLIVDGIRRDLEQATGALHEIARQHRTDVGYTNELRKRLAFHEQGQLAPSRKRYDVREALRARALAKKVGSNGAAICGEIRRTDFGAFACALPPGHPGLHASENDTGQKATWGVEEELPVESDEAVEPPPPAEAADHDGDTPE